MHQEGTTSDHVPVLVLEYSNIRNPPQEFALGPSACLPEMIPLARILARTECLSFQQPACPMMLPENVKVLRWAFW